MAIHGEGIEIRPFPRNLWRDAVIGMAAGIVGTLAMDRYFRIVSGLTSDDGEDESTEDRSTSGDDAEEIAAAEDEGPLDDVALVGPFHREEESAPETLARVGYVKLHDEEPSDETRKTLARQIHWATGMGLGVAYGLLRGDAEDGLDLTGGLLFGAGAWLMNDELLVPLLGLSKGPTAHQLEEHAQALGAHVVYGIATAAATQVLERVL